MLTFKTEDAQIAFDASYKVTRRNTMHRDGTESLSFYLKDDTSQNGRIDKVINKSDAKKIKFAYFWRKAVEKSMFENVGEMHVQYMKESLTAMNVLDTLLQSSQGNRIKTEDIQKIINEQNFGLTAKYLCETFFENKEAFESLMHFTCNRNGKNFISSNAKDGLITFQMEDMENLNNRN